MICLEDFCRTRGIWFQYWKRLQRVEGGYEVQGKRWKYDWSPLTRQGLKLHRYSYAELWMKNRLGLKMESGFSMMWENALTAKCPKIKAVWTGFKEVWTFFIFFISMAISTLPRVRKGCCGKQMPRLFNLPADPAMNI